MRNQTTSAWDTLLLLRPPEDGPLHQRLELALREAITAGRIAVGDALPASRGLAAELGCSRWAVTEAYGQLVAEGYLRARSGSATRVSWSGHPARVRTPAHPSPSGPVLDLAPGLPDLRHFPRPAWARALRDAVSALPDDDLGYPDPRGHVRLRRLLSAYVERARGAVADEDDVLVCSSVTDGVRQVCAALRTQGIREVGCEEPGWTRLRDVVVATGLTAVPVPVDRHGLRVDALRAHRGLRAVLTTPAHQFPSGTVLVPRRRAALLEWAREVDGLVLEDDYDAEFRYDRRPVGTVQGMDPSRVVLLKSVSKTLSPALGLGWLVAPRRWAELLHDPERAARLPPVVDQLALASLVGSGAYDRHLRVARRRYQARRDALARALGTHLPTARISGAAAGLHLVLDPGDHVDAEQVAATAGRQGVRVVALSAYSAEPPAASASLVLGYGNLADASVDEAVRRLAVAIGDAG